VGGPIVKNKTHFFGSYERRTANRTSSVVIPATLVDFVKSLGYDTRTDLSVPSKFNNYFGKINHQLTTTNSLSLTYLYDNRNVQNTQAGGTLAADSGYGDVRAFVLPDGEPDVPDRRAERQRVPVQRLVSAVVPHRNQGHGPTLNFPSITFGRDQTQGRSQSKLDPLRHDVLQHHQSFDPLWLRRHRGSRPQVFEPELSGSVRLSYRSAGQSGESRDPALSILLRVSELRKLHDWTISGYSGTGMQRDVTMYAAFRE